MRFPVIAALLSLLHSPLLQASEGSADWCAKLGQRLRSVSTTDCLRTGFAAADLTSANGHPLMLRDFPPSLRQAAHHGGTPEATPRILVIGGIHGDELTSVSLVFRWLQWIDEAPATRFHWRVIPLANPDGLLASPATRYNGHGVDLNRNFPTPDWERDAHRYWIERTRRDPRRFPGETAMSENETRWLQQQIEDFRPDAIVSIHAPYGILDYDGPAHRPRRFGRLDLNQLGVYPGSLGNYGGVFKNLPVVTIELPHATAMPPLREQRAIWRDMLDWMQRHIAGKTIS